MSDSLVPILTGCMLIAVITLVLFNIQRFLHELGHFVVARCAGVTVNELGIGLPPRAVRIYQGDRTLFTLNWLPFGSFTRMAGEKDANVPDGFAGKSKKTRFAILIAGPLIGLFVLGLCLLPSVVLYAFAYMAGSPEYTTGTNIDGDEKPLAQAVITEVVDGAPAAEAGLQPEDKIAGADGIEFRCEGDALTYVARNKGTEITLLIDRDGVQMEVPVVPRANPPEGQGPLGVSMTYQYEGREIVRYPWPSALAKGADVTFQHLSMGISIPFAVLVGKMPAEVLRPVTAAEMDGIFRGNELMSSSPWFFYYLMWGAQILTFVFPLVVLNLISLLPLPGWDTWCLLSLLKSEKNK